MSKWTGGYYEHSTPSEQGVIMSKWTGGYYEHSTPSGQGVIMSTVHPVDRGL